MRVPGSLRLRITLAATLACAVTVSAGAAGMARYSEDRQIEQIDAQLASDARVTQRVIETRADVPDVGPTGLIVQVFNDGGDFLGGNAQGNHTDPLIGDPPPWARNPRAGAGSVTIHRAELGEVRTRYVPLTKGGGWILTARTTNDLRRSVRSLRDTLLVVVPVLTFAFAALTWIVVGRALRPVKTIRTTVGEITERDLSQRLAIRGTGDEIDRLAATMNAMLDRLEGASERERRLVADASHELRSPLAAVRALIQSRPADPDQGARHDAMALDALTRLQALVDQLLELARHDRRQATAMRPVDLDGIVLQHADLLRHTTDLTVDSSQVSGGQVLGSEEALGRMVENLTANAARHARQLVRLSVREVGDQVELIVTDDGAGIAAEERASVFERFTRLDDSRTRGGAGAGLGLAIVAAIVDRHGGTVAVGDGLGIEPAGSGTSMTVRLPATHGATDGEPD